MKLGVVLLLVVCRSSSLWLCCLTASSYLFIYLCFLCVHLVMDKIILFKISLNARLFVWVKLVNWAKLFLALLLVNFCCWVIFLGLFILFHILNLTLKGGKC